MLRRVHQLRPRPRTAADVRAGLHHRGGHQAVLRRLPGELRDAAVHEVRGLHAVRDELSRSTACSWAAALAMFAVLYLLLTRTRIGIIVRAATYRPTMVEALGHNLPVVFMGVFAAARRWPGSRAPSPGRSSRRPEHGGRFRHAGLRGGRGRRPGLAGGRAGGLADDRPLHLVLGRPQLVALRLVRRRRPRRLGARGRAGSSRCSSRRSRPACRSC